MNGIAAACGILTRNVKAAEKLRILFAQAAKDLPTRCLTRYQLILLLLFKAMNWQDC